MIDNIKKNLPILYILAIWFVFSSPYFVKGLAPFPSKYQVNHFPPWSHYQKFWGPVQNAAMPDVIDQIYPWRHLVIESWKKGEVPLWNPYNFAGNPLLANFQSAALSPFNVLFLILPFIDAWSLLVLLQPLLAGTFVYLFMRELKTSPQGSLFSSIAFMFCGFLVVWMAYGTLALAISFLPLALYAIEKYFNTKQFIFLILLTITLPLSFFSGHFQTSLYFLIFIFAFIVFKFLATKKIQSTVFVAVYTFFGLLLAMPQILPSIEFYNHSVRSESFNFGSGMPWWYLVNLFSPDFFGNPVTRNDWAGYYAEWASFIGIIPFFLAVFGILRKSKNTFFFAIAGAVSLLLAVESPLLGVIEALKLPVISTSNPTRIIVLFSFSLSILAGLGWDNFLFSKRKFKDFFVPIFLIGAIIVGAWLTLSSLKPMPFDKILIAKRNLILPTMLFLLAAFLVFAASFQKRLLRIAFLILILGTSLDSLRFATKWMPFDPKNLVFANLPVIHELQKQLSHNRYFGNLGAQVASYYSLQSLDGYDPLYIQRYGEFIQSSPIGSFENALRSVVKTPRIGDFTDRILDLLSIRIIFHPIADTNQGWAYPVWKKSDRLQQIYKDDRFELYENKAILARTQLFYDYEVIQNNKQLLKKFFSKEFDFRKKLLLEEKVENVLKPGSGVAELLKYSQKSIDISATTSSPALLFLGDNYYPGWKAYVDGKETKIFRANYSFRAIVVPDGRHEVKFAYKPESFAFGVGLAVIGLLGMGIVSTFEKKKI